MVLKIQVFCDVKCFGCYAALNDKRSPTFRRTAVSSSDLEDEGTTSYDKWVTTRVYQRTQSASVQTHCKLEGKRRSSHGSGG